MILIIESIARCILFTIMVYIMSRNPIKTLYNYPPKIQERVKTLDEYKDAGAMIINRSDFIMVYSATIRAGVELKEVKIESNTTNPNEIIIKMPKAKIFDCHVDQNEIQYFDEKFALFNVDSKEDANKACALAEQDGIKEAEATGILEFAETEAEYVIKDILTPALPEGYTLTVKKAE